MLDAVVDYLPSPLDVPPTHGQRPQDTGELVTARAKDDAPFAALVFKIMTDPFVGQLAFLRVYSGSLKTRRHRAQHHQGHEGAHRPPAEDARQQARGDQGGLRGRHRGRGGPQERDHRRHHLRSRRTRWCWSPSTSRRPSSRWPWSPRPRATRRSWAPGLAKLMQEDPTFKVETDTRHRPDQDLRHGRAAPGDHRGPPEARVRRGGQRGQAAGGLQGDDPQGGQGRGQVHQADRRPAASTATPRSSWSPRPARASSSRTTSRAAPSPRSSSSPSRRASARRWSAASWPATRWWT